MASACLALDIGNTRIKAAYIIEGQLIEVRTLHGRRQLTQWRSVYPQLPFYVIDTRRSSHWQVALQALEACFLEAEHGLPFPTAYAQTLGPDRCAALSALWHIAPKPLLYLSFGTALTGDLLDEHGRHIGGFITPSLFLRRKALHEHTGRLPLIPLDACALPRWATTTPEAIAAGTFWGLLAELQAHLTAAQATVGPFHLWISGGEARFWQPHLPQSATFAPNLTLLGVWYWARHLFGDSL